MTRKKIKTTIKPRDLEAVELRVYFNVCFSQPVVKTRAAKYSGLTRAEAVRIANNYREEWHNCLGTMILKR